ncbi:putative PEX3 peroxisomal biogenesis factor 3 [Triangularia verruculosa]|uniref:PEX3 peroxisomal biogenesis factor 3 n=1 Tax=Triangularia verruculosa TaxID=2587418 RepID=A0AAN7APU8_9PEZI|nr:putative PEX3 peroxisomal biogenesis factor 3 [Triangularia verruculosa]
MLAATKRWFRRNRTPLAIGAGVVGAGYVVTNYVLGKLQDARERMSSDRIAKENLRRRFEQNQEDCTFTVLALLPAATTNILEAMNTEKITYEIQQMKASAVARTKSIGSTSPPSLSAETDDDGRSMFSVSVTSEAGAPPSQLAVPTSLAAVVEGSAPVDGAQEGEAATTPPKPKKTKRQLWNDLTISSITRAYTLLYTLSLLTMLTRIQLNLLGRRSYLSSVVSLATGTAQQTISLENNDDDGNHEHYYGSDFEVNRRYLTFSWWLLNRGWVDVMQRVEAAVRQVFGHLSPRDTVTIENFLQLTSNVRTLVEGSAPSNGVGTAWLRFLLPPEKLEDFVLRESGILDDSSSSSSPSPTTEEGSVTPTNVQLRRLLDESADLIDSPTFSNVLTQILDAGFDTLKGQLAKDVVGVSTITEDMSGFTSRAVLLPKILSVLTRQAHDIGNGMPNRYLQAMEQVRDLEGFAAVVYSSNWQAEIAQDEELELGQQRQREANTTEPGSASGLVRDVQSPGLEGSTVVGAGDESIVVVGQDPQGSFEGAWERAMSTEQQR